MNIAYKQVPTLEELQSFERDNRLATLAITPGWSDLKGVFKAWLEKAQDTIDASLSTDREVVYRLNLRRQVMKSILSDIEALVESAAQRAKDLIEDLQTEPPLHQSIGDEFAEREDSE